MFVAIGYFWLIRQTFIILTFVLVAKYFGEAVLPPRLVRPRATAPPPLDTPLQMCSLLTLNRNINEGQIYSRGVTSLLTLGSANPHPPTTLLRRHW